MMFIINGYKMVVDDNNMVIDDYEPEVLLTRHPFEVFFFGEVLDDLHHQWL